MAKNVDPDVLMPAERRDWKALIQRRVATMLGALDEQLGGTVDAIIAELRLQHNVTLNESELGDLVKNLDEQIKSEIVKYLNDERSRIEMAVEQTGDEYDLKEREMKARHKREWEDTQRERKERLENLKAQMRQAEEKVAKEHTTELLNKKRDYQSQLIKVREIEKLITVEAQNRLAIMKRSKGRLVNLITDAGNRAFEQLMLIDTRTQAKDLLESIPTIQEAVDLCRSADGLNQLMQRLDPNTRALPAPSIANNVIIDNGNGQARSVQATIIVDGGDAPVDAPVEVPSTLEVDIPERDNYYDHDQEVYHRTPTRRY